MKNYRPLLLQEMDVRLPGLHLQRLRLNRHLPDLDQVAPHTHGYAQIHCHLSGHGMMMSDNRPFETAPGTVVFLPQRHNHGFRETAKRRPLCLVLDFDWRGAVRHGFSLVKLGQSDTGAIRRELTELTRLADPGAAACRIVVGAVALRILDILLRGLDILPQQPKSVPGCVRQFDRLVNQSTIPLQPIADLARQMGWQPDHLNRTFKAATGQTLREHRDAVLVKKAKRLLREQPRIGDAAAALGFPDQNYFSRWFKKQTGLQPRVCAMSKSTSVTKRG